MGKETGISWTDHTFNPWIGCTKVSPGCDNCYAETLNHRWGKDNWGKGKPRTVTSAAYWKEALRWNRDAENAGVQRKVFCASLADVMDDEAPEGARERLWKLIDETPHLIWQLLTKRPQRFAEYLPPFGFLHKNVWLGITAENQHFYDIRWGYLWVQRNIGRCAAAFVSYEPALGPLSMAKWSTVPDWLIFGGETGNGRRACEVEWAKAIQEECRTSGVSFFMKQMSAKTPTQAKALIPELLNIQQFPSLDGI